jgi:hypothetical protein
VTSAQPRARNALAALLAIVAAAAIAVSAGLAWVHGQVLDGPRFVANAAPAATDPATTQVVASLLVQDVGGALRPVVEAPRDDGSLPDTQAFELSLDTAAAEAAISPQWVALWSQGWATYAERTRALLGGAPPTQQELDGTTVTFALAPLADQVRDQVALAGYPEVAGLPVSTQPLTLRTTSTLADEVSPLTSWPERWWLVLLLGLVSAGSAYAVSTRRGRLSLLLGADLIAGGAAIWLLATLAGGVAGERGLDESSRSILSATYQPFGELLARDGVITGVVGAFVMVLGLVAIVAARQQDRRVRSVASTQRQGSTAAPEVP